MSTNTASNSRRARTRAREIAARLAVRDPAPHRPRRGGEEILSRPYSGNGGEVDLDHTLDALAERRALAPEEVIVRERQRTRRQVVLAVDVSGSMRGERVRMAAATVGALAARLRDDEIGVVAFWSDAVILRRLTRRLHAGALLDDLAGVPARGLTNVAFGLHAAGNVADAGRGERRVLLISDCVHNAGPDPAGVARSLPRVDVLVDVSGEHDLDVARGVARAGRGVALPVRTHRDVAVAVARCFADRTAAVRR